MITLNNVYQVGAAQAGSISTDNNKIAYLNAYGHKEALQLYFDDAIVFPGLINSHDHLDFNLFPQLGNCIYGSYVEWGNHIHQTFKNEIAAVLRIPQELRVRWGLYKNLLCGVTTVVNHGAQLRPADSPISVFEHCQSLHSVQFERRWKFKLNNPRRVALPVAIHAGEGTAPDTQREIDQLIRWNLLNRRLIAIHGVAMNAVQAKHFQGLVWCPESNFFLLGKTAGINTIKTQIPVLFGTDATLTGSWNIWEHLRLAQQTDQLNNEELWHSLNTVPADVWGLETGTIAPGMAADMVVARLHGNPPDYQTLFKLNPEDLLLVMHSGQVRLFDESLYAQLSYINRTAFYKVTVGNSIKYVYGNLPGLMEDILSYYPEAKFHTSRNNPPAYYRQGA